MSAINQPGAERFSLPQDARDVDIKESVGTEKEVRSGILIKVGGLGRTKLHVLVLKCYSMHLLKWTSEASQGGRPMIHQKCPSGLPEST